MTSSYATNKSHISSNITENPMPFTVTIVREKLLRIFYRWFIHWAEHVGIWRTWEKSDWTGPKSPNLSASISWTMACCVPISEERCAMDSVMHSTKMFIIWTALTWVPLSLGPWRAACASLRRGVPQNVPASQRGSPTFINQQIFVKFKKKSLTSIICLYLQQLRWFSKHF